jgi:hypothetical protein
MDVIRGNKNFLTGKNMQPDKVNLHSAGVFFISC